MKFVVGFLGGMIVGAVGAVAYSVQTGRDLREEFEGVRSDLARRDLDALGSRLESRVTEMQAQFETRMNQVRERAGAAVDEARSGGTDEAGVAEAAEGAVTAAADAAEAASEAVAEQAEAAKEQAEG